MDGKALLFVFAGLCATGYYLSVEGLTLGTVESGPSDPPKRVSTVVDLRHNAVREELIRERADLSDPRSFVFEHEGLTMVGGPVAATEHGFPVFLSDIFPWHVYPGAKDQPSRLDPVPVVESCRISPPDVDSRVANVWSGPTLQPVPIYAYFEDELDDAAIKFMAQAPTAVQEPRGLIERFAEAARAGTPEVRDTDPYRLSVLDVVVTETDSPIHLILQTDRGRLLWNLSLAPDVELSGVTMLGGDIVALTNLPDDVPVQVLTAPVLASCAPARVRLPLSTDPVFAEVENGTIAAEAVREALASRIQAVDEWNAWFQFQFGVRDDQTRIGYDVAGIAALVGPIPSRPEERVGYHGFKGRAAIVAPDVPTILSEPAKADQRWRLRVQKRATTLGSGRVVSVPTGTN